MAGKSVASSGRRQLPAIAAMAWLCALAVCPAAEEPAYRGPVKSLVPTFAPPDSGKKSGNGLDFLTPNNSLGPVIDTPMITPPPQPRMPLTRERQEANDRKKNWIFVTPQTSTETPESLLGVRKEKDFNEDKEFKGVMQSYLEKDDKKDKADNKNDKDPSSRTNNTEKVRDDLDPGQDDTRFGLKSDPLSSPMDRDDKRGRKDSKDREEKKDSPERSRSTSVFTRMNGESSTGSIATPFELDRSSFLSSGNASPVRKTEDRKAWDNEFKQLLEGGPSISERRSGLGDPINALNDATRQPLNPTVSAPSDFARPIESRGAFDSLNRPGGMEGLSRPANLTDFSTKMLGTSSLSPAIVAPPQQVFVQPKPMVLEIPRRKF